LLKLLKIYLSLPLTGLGVDAVGKHGDVIELAHEHFDGAQCTTPPLIRSTT
jgi:hypothetical protein